MNTIEYEILGNNRFSNYIIERYLDNIECNYYLKKGKKKRLVFAFSKQYFAEIKTRKKMIEFITRMSENFGITKVYIKENSFGKLSERATVQEEYKEGDIVLVRPLTNQIDIHMYLIKSLFEGYIEAYMLTSNMKKAVFPNVVVTPNDTNNLFVECVLKTDHSYQISQNLIMGKIGEYG